MGFPRQESWSGLPFATPGDRPDPRIEPVSAALQALFPSKPPAKPILIWISFFYKFHQKWAYHLISFTWSNWNVCCLSPPHPLISPGPLLWSLVAKTAGSSTKISTWDFLGSPGVKTPPSTAGVAVTSSRGSSPPRDWIRVSYASWLAGGIFTTSASWEAPVSHKT